MHRVVTIDGPAGAGKTTVCKQLAERLGWSYLDTGAMYRVLTWAAVRSGVDLENESELADLIQAARVTVEAGRAYWHNEDVTGEIRTPEITEASRFLADSPSVRQGLVALQREFARGKSVVTEGRDQGTVVFPDAYRKYYLTASEEERAKRRALQQGLAGENPAALEAVLRSQRERDARDATRAIGAMKQAADAQLIDSTGLSISEVVDLLARDIEAGMAAS
jgi:CMP/dCMP kinase